MIRVILPLNWTILHARFHLPVPNRCISVSTFSTRLIGRCVTLRPSQRTIFTTADHLSRHLADFRDCHDRYFSCLHLAGAQNAPVKSDCLFPMKGIANCKRSDNTIACASALPPVPQTPILGQPPTLDPEASAGFGVIQSVGTTSGGVG